MRSALIMATLLAWLPAQRPLQGSPLQGSPLQGSPLQGSPLQGSPLQESPQAGTPPGPSRPQSARQQRLRRDLKQVAANLHSKPHGYRGSLVVASSSDLTLLMPLERDFVGAADGKLSWFSMSRWQSVTYGEQTLGRRIPARVPGALRANHKEPAWGKPAGASPEVPLSPALLAPHFEHATLGSPEPTEHLGRPAMRVYASWRGRPAKKVVYATTVPSTQHEQVLEALGSALAKGRKNIRVDAVIVFDPASKCWLAATLRLAQCTGKPLPPDEEGNEPPAGMPALASDPQIEVTWRLESCAPERLTMPTLDAAARQRLGLPASGARKR